VPAVPQTQHWSRLNVGSNSEAGINSTTHDLSLKMTRRAWRVAIFCWRWRWEILYWFVLDGDPVWFQIVWVVVVGLSSKVWNSSIPSARNYLTLRLSAWRCHMEASDLNVAFSKSITRCLSTVSCAVDTRLAIASDIESTSILCLRSGRRETSTTDVFTSLLTLPVWVDEAGVCWTYIPRQLPIHPTAINAIHPVARRHLSFLHEL